LNATFGEGAARAVDGVTVAVQAPTDPGARIGMLARIENVELSPGTAPARVVVNSRTGTVVIGSQVRVSPAAISHGSLTVTVSESTQVSQPNAFGNGQTVASPPGDLIAILEALKQAGALSADLEVI
jgi:flagellar P-ring protein precursor FlgI